MSKLLTTLSLMLAVLIGSTGVSYAEDKSPIKPLDNQITIGNADYNNATTNINLNLNINDEKSSIELSFLQSVKSQKNSRTFLIKILNCRIIGRHLLSIPKPKEFCKLARNTKFTFRKFNSQYKLEVRFTNTVLGAMDFNLRSNLNLEKISFSGTLSDSKIPLFSIYEKLNGYINLDKKKGEVVLLKRNGEELRETLLIKNNRAYKNGVALGGAPISSEQMSMITGYIIAFQDILKSDEMWLYFGGETVKQGQVLKENILKLWNVIQPSSYKGYTVLGTKKYLGRDSIVVKPEIDMDPQQLLNGLSNAEKSQLKKFNIIFDDQGALVYVDLLSGIPTFWEIAIDAKISDKIRTNTMKIKFLANTVFKKTKPENTHSTNDIQSRLSKLKKLLDAGLITKEEAATKRKTILDSL
jgi:hypothetical protein